MGRTTISMESRGARPGMTASSLRLTQGMPGRGWITQTSGGMPVAWGGFCKPIRSLDQQA